MPLPLRDDQVMDLAFYIANSKSLNLSDPGTGKTPSLDVYIEYLKTYQGCETDFVMPKSLLKKNRDEILRFTNLEPDEVIIIDGTPAERQEQIARASTVRLMGFTRFSDDWKVIRSHHPKTNAVLVDELHMAFGSIGSQRTIQLKNAVKNSDVFLGATGSLINGKLTSAYPAIHIIEPRYYVSESQFENFHAIKDPWTGKITGWRNHDKLGRIFMRHSIRHTFEEIFGDQEIVFIPELCEMSAVQRAAYDKFAARAYLELENEVIDGTLPGVNTIRARQIMGHPETFEGLMPKGELTGKDQRLLIHLADHANTGAPLIIYAAFIPEQRRIAELCRKQGFKVSLINSQVTGQRREQEREDFEASRTQIMVASPETSSVGFNWGHVDHIIFASIDYKDTNFSQAYKRAIRGKRLRPLRVTILGYERSLDQRVFTIVTGKSAEANKVDSTYKILELANWGDHLSGGAVSPA